MKTMIASFTQENHQNWDKHLSEFRFVMNTAVHSSLKTSPAFLNFGRKPRPPQTIKRREEGQPEIIELSVDEWKDRKKRRQALRDLVTLHLETASDRQERYYNKRHREVVYEIGDRVMRRQHVLSSAANFVSSKLAPKYKGLYTVIRVLSKVVYEVTDSEGRVDKVHVKDLKPYYEQGFPNVEVLSDDYRSHPRKK